MDALRHSLSTLNVQASLAHRPASRPFKLSLLPLAHQTTPVHSSLLFNPLQSKVQQQGCGRGKASKAVVSMGKNASSGYAAALAEVGKSQNILHALYSDMEKIGRYLGDEQFSTFINNPVAKEEGKKSVIRALAREAQFQPVTVNLFNLLIDKKRTGILQDIVKEFEEIYNEMTDTQVAVVTSAVEIQTPQLSLIGKKVQSMAGCKNVKMKNVIDPSVIAGFILRFGKGGSRLIDMSVKGQLDRIASQIEIAEKAAVF